MVRIHFKSYLVYLTIAGLCLFKKKRINNLYTRRFKVVHIVCPGPSATALLEYKFGPNETIIFINHAIKMSSKVIGPKEKFYFSADGTRTDEIISQCSNELVDCTSILATGHLFHINLEIIKNISIILLPQVKLSKKYGLSGLSKGPTNFTKLSKRPVGYGFSSLNHSLQLAVLFTPIKINLWGCDIGEKNGVRYYDSSIPIRQKEYFNLAKAHFDIIEKKIESLGIVIERMKGK